MVRPVGQWPPDGLAEDAVGTGGQDQGLDGDLEAGFQMMDDAKLCQTLIMKIPDLEVFELGTGGDQALNLAGPALHDARCVRQVERRLSGQLVVDPRAERERPQGVASEGVPCRPPGDKRLEALDDPLLDAKRGEVLEADTGFLQVQVPQSLLHPRPDGELAAEPDAVAHVGVAQGGEIRGGIEEEWDDPRLCVGDVERQEELLEGVAEGRLDGEEPLTPLVPHRVSLRVARSHYAWAVIMTKRPKIT